MAKGDKAAVDTNINNMRNQFNTGWESNKNIWGQGASDWSNATQGVFGNTAGALSKFFSGGGPNYAPTDKMISDLWYGSGVGGGIDDSLIQNMGADTFGGFKNFADNGGLSPEFRTNFNNLAGKVNQGISDFQSIFDNPISAQDEQGMMANGSFQNFIDTGGFTPDQIQSIRARSVAPTQALYSNAQDELSRQSALSGGYGGSTGAAQEAMARDLAQSTERANVDTEAGIAQMVQQGKEFGTAGMSDAASKAAQLKLQGREAGATGVTQSALAEQQAQTQVQQLDDQMRLAGLSGMTDIEKTRLQGELENAQINEQAGAVNAELQAQKAMMQFGAEFQAPIIAGQQTLQGIGAGTGLAGLGASLLGQYNNLFQNSTQNQFQDLLGLGGQQIQASQIPGDFQTALGNIGSALNLGSDVFGSLFGGSGGLSKIFGGGIGGGFNGTGTMGFPGDNVSGVNSPLGGGPMANLYGGFYNPLTWNNLQQGIWGAQ